MLIALLLFAWIGQRALDVEVGSLTLLPGWPLAWYLAQSRCSLHMCLPDGSVLEPWRPVRCPSSLMAIPGFNARHEKVAVPRKSATLCCLHHAEWAPSSRGEERTLLPTPADLPKRNSFAHQRSRQVVANGLWVLGLSSKLSSKSIRQDLTVLSADLWK